MVEDGCSRTVVVGMNSSCGLCYLAGPGRQGPEALSWQHWGHHNPECQAAEKLGGGIKGIELLVKMQKDT